MLPKSGTILQFQPGAIYFPLPWLYVRVYNIILYKRISKSRGRSRLVKTLSRRNRHIPILVGCIPFPILAPKVSLKQPICQSYDSGLLAFSNFLESCFISILPAEVVWQRMVHQLPQKGHSDSPSKKRS